MREKTQQEARARQEEDARGQQAARDKPAALPPDDPSDPEELEVVVDPADHDLPERGTRDHRANSAPMTGPNSSSEEDSMDQHAGTPDPNAESGAPAGPRHLRPVPSDDPAAPPRKKRTGPKTPQGKAHSSRNAIGFGIHSPAPLIPGEGREEWEKHRAGMPASVEPANYVETFRAERMVSASWVLMNGSTAYEVAEFTRAQPGERGLSPTARQRTRQDPALRGPRDQAVLSAHT
jgi:hypothetical protein